MLHESSYILFCVIQVHALLYVLKMSFCESILDVTARHALLLRAGLYAARVLIYIILCYSE